MTRVWRDAIVEEGSLTKCISQLRKALGRSAEGQEYIQTVPTKGYRFLAQVETRAPSSPSAFKREEVKDAKDTDTPLRGRTVVLAEASAPLRVDEIETGIPAVLEPEESALPPTPGDSKPHPLKRFWWICGLAGGVLLLALGVFYWWQPVPELKVLAFHQLTNDGREKRDAYRGGVPGALLTDGSRIYFPEVSGSNFVPAQVAVGGGPTVPIRLPAYSPDLIPLEISHDGTKLLASGEHRLQPSNPFWVLPVPSLAPQRLGDLLGHDGTWSPDGQTFVYARGNGLYAASGQGIPRRELVALKGEAWWIRFSPDGRRLRFTLAEEKSDEMSLWEVASDGTGPHALLPGWSKPPAECCGNWTPDGKYYIFQASHGGDAEIWAISDQSSLFHHSETTPVKLTQGPMEFRSPVPSRDGTRIFAVGEQRRGELVRYDRNSGAFIPYLSGISADHVEFSPDRQWIAYSAFPEETIWRSKPDGSDKLQLSFPPLQALFPRWSPDGQQIAFLGFEPGGPLRVYFASAQGGSPRLMLSSGFSQVDPNWSPDGKHVMFGAMRPGASPSGDIEIFDCTSQRVTKLPGSEGLTNPRWSPDGRYVVAKSTIPKGPLASALVLYDFQLQSWTPFEQDPVDNKWWSHDGAYVYFDKFPETDAAIFRERISDRQIERVVNLKDVRRAWGSLGWWFGLAPDDSPILTRDNSIEEIYALDLPGK